MFSHVCSIHTTVKKTNKLKIVLSYTTCLLYYTYTTAWYIMYIRYLF